MTGFHERALGAFNAGAAVLAAPNHVLESNFLHGKDMLIYRDVLELPDLINDLLADPDRLQRLGQHGHSKAIAQFSPSRLIETILAHWRLYYRNPQTSAAAQDDAASAAA
jgi:spore maturation protein CgeB